MIHPIYEYDEDDWIQSNVSHPYETHSYEIRPYDPISINTLRFIYVCLFSLSICCVRSKIKSKYI